MEDKTVSLKNAFQQSYTDLPLMLLATSQKPTPASYSRSRKMVSLLWAGSHVAQLQEMLLAFISSWIEPPRFVQWAGPSGQLHTWLKIKEI